MKKIISIVVLLLFLGPISVSGKDFSWFMFLPAITGHSLCTNTNVTCENIAGCYEGAFTDNCPGFVVAGRMDFILNADCSFSSFSNYGVQTSGSITGCNGSTYTGSGTTDPTGCGAFLLTCTGTMSSIACNYTYTNGKTGAIPNALSVACN